MKHFAKLLAASLAAFDRAMGQAFLPQQPEPPFKQPDAPQLPYHFSTQITGPVASSSAMSRPWRFAPTAISWCSTATPTS